MDIPYVEPLLVFLLNFGAFGLSPLVYWDKREKVCKLFWGCGAGSGVRVSQLVRLDQDNLQWSCCCRHVASYRSRKSQAEISTASRPVLHVTAFRTIETFQAAPARIPTKHPERAFGADALTR